jgi:capsular polysaccharide biosynthesis protein
MVQLFRDQCRDERDGFTSLWVQTGADMVKTFFREHLSQLRHFEAPSSMVFKRVFVAIFASACVFSTCQAFWTTRVYSSTARIEVVDNEHDNATYFLTKQNFLIEQFKFLEEQFKILDSEHVLANVIATLHLDSKLAAQSGETNRWTMARTYKALLSQITITPADATSLIDISVRNPDPKLAADIANSIVDASRKIEILQRDAAFAKNRILREQVADLVAIQMMKGGHRPDEEPLVEERWLEFNSATNKIQTALDNKVVKSSSILIVRDPARPNIKPVQGGPQLFYAWMLRGAIIALMTGVLAACVNHLLRRLSRHENTLAAGS